MSAVAIIGDHLPVIFCEPSRVRDEVDSGVAALGAGPKIAAMSESPIPMVAGDPVADATGGSMVSHAFSVSLYGFPVVECD